MQSSAAEKGKGCPLELVKESTKSQPRVNKTLKSRPSTQFHQNSLCAWFEWEGPVSEPAVVAVHEQYLYHWEMVCWWVEQGVWLLAVALHLAKI